MAANGFIPKHRLNSAHFLQAEQHLLKKHYDFLDTRISGGVLFAYGSCRPSPYSVIYHYKLKLAPGKQPKVYPVDPLIPYNEDIHLYSDDNRLCLYYPNDFSWTDSSHLYNTIIPWTHEWFLFYELYLIKGKWLHPFVEHRKYNVMDFKPSIFIGSSKEGLAVAEIIEAGLAGIAACTLWTKAFEFGKSNFDNLASQIAFYDYAILVATGDDMVRSRKRTLRGARDNVLFEFGLFTGGLGRSRVFYMMESGIRIPSDLLGLTLPLVPSASSPDFMKGVNASVSAIRQHIADKEKTFDLGFLPSTALAYGYFANFVERTVERLLEDKADGKTFSLQNGKVFKIKDLKFTILVPDDLGDDMFNKVKAKRLRDGWEKMKVDPKHIRDYDFSVDISRVADGEMHLVDIPFTLNALNKSIALYAGRHHIGKTLKDNLLEYREIRNFKRTLEYMIETSSLARDIVKVEIVAI